MDEISNDAIKTRSRSTNRKMIDTIDDINSAIHCDGKDSDEDVVGPLCTSMKKLNSMTSQNYDQQLKTPSETSMMSKSSEATRGTSFRKSLVFDSGLTPHDDESTASSNAKSNSVHQAGERPKAKTSLSFAESSISVRSFYGTPAEKPTAIVIKSKPDDDLIERINNHKLATARNKYRIKSKSTTKSKSLTKRMKAPSLWRFSGKMKINRFKRQRTQKSTNKKKSHPSKSAGDVGQERLLNINNIENLPPNGAEFTSRIEQNLRLQKILKDQENSLTASRDIDWNGGAKANETRSQARLLDSDVEDEDSDSEFLHAHGRSTYEEIEVEIEEPVTESEPTNRKFFKSNGSNSAKKYRIMGRLSATLKRGGDLKFDPPLKRKKKRPSKGEQIVLHNEITSIIDRLTSPSKVGLNLATAESDSEDGMLKPKTKEVTHIVECGSEALTVVNKQLIDQQPDFIQNMPLESVDTTFAFTALDVDKYRKMIPYNTTDPDKISQQESILELLISNGICDDETFKVFIAEPDLHKEKASQILDSLYCVNTMIPTEYENIEWIPPIESPTTFENTTAKTASTATATATVSALAIDGLTDQATVEAFVPSELGVSNITMVPDENSNSSNDERTRFFPIFNMKINAKEPKAATFNALNRRAKEWIPIGNQQYQLDVGQKEFGVRTCPQCEMQYSVHEPEDEILHLKYHNFVNILAFNGWANERIVTQITDWGIDGRIIYVCEADSKAKKERVKEVLNMVDRDLGFAAYTELKPKTLVYLAIAKQQIIGVCVAEPLERAHRLKTDQNGIDCFSIETYPVKCGISRVWVAAQYRRHGIAAKLITSVRGHFLFGAFLSCDEIAFSSPTEDGKRFAAKLIQRNDFLIYGN